DLSIPRKQFWTDRIPNKYRCPLCRSKLEKEYVTYMFVVEEDEEKQAYISGNDLGAFCPQCPVVVLDMKEFVHMVVETAGVTEDTSLVFMLLGIINFDAIPEEKKHLPIGDKDTPIPLVEFVDTVKGATVRQR